MIIFKDKNQLFLALFLILLISPLVSATNISVVYNSSLITSANTIGEFTDNNFRFVIGMPVLNAINYNNKSWIWLQNFYEVSSLAYYWNDTNWVRDSYLDWYVVQLQGDFSHSQIVTINNQLVGIDLYQTHASSFNGTTWSNDNSSLRAGLSAYEGQGYTTLSSVIINSETYLIVSKNDLSMNPELAYYKWNGTYWVNASAQLSGITNFYDYNFYDNSSERVGFRWLPIYTFDGTYLLSIAQSGISAYGQVNGISIHGITKWNGLSWVNGSQDFEGLVYGRPLIAPSTSYYGSLLFYFNGSFFFNGTDYNPSYYPIERLSVYGLPSSPIDIIPPTIINNSITGDIEIVGTPYPYLLNFTANDTNLDSCWYFTTENYTNITRSCSGSTPIIFLTNGVKDIHIFANDTSSNVGTLDLNINLMTIVISEGSSHGFLYNFLAEIGAGVGGFVQYLAIPLGILLLLIIIISVLVWIFYAFTNKISSVIKI